MIAKLSSQMFCCIRKPFPISCTAVQKVIFLLPLKGELDFKYVPLTKYIGVFG